MKSSKQQTPKDIVKSNSEPLPYKTYTRARELKGSQLLFCNDTNPADQVVLEKKLFKARRTLSESKPTHSTLMAML